jgi:capsular polysaccharide transport system permease protein
MLQVTSEIESAIRTRPGLPRLRPLPLFFTFVVLPTLIVIGYLLLFASPQYRSEAQFVVRGMQAEPLAPSGLGQMLGMAPGLSGSQKEAQAIREYLLSRDAIDALHSRKIDVATLYGRTGADYFSRLRPARPTAEKLVDYYRQRVSIAYSTEDNITRIAVTAFSPKDAQRINVALIALGEERINLLNDRAIEAGTTLAADDMMVAEDDLQKVQSNLTKYRDLTGSIDPVRKSESEQKQASEQDAILARERALLRDMARYLDASSPQMIAMRSRVVELERSLANTETKLTGSPKALTQKLARFEELKLKQELATKRYDAARMALENARTQAAKQRLFLVSLVKPGLPERAVAPRPWRTGLTVFMALAVAFAILWLLISGIREHSAD